jgi:hypothetical protein
VTRASQESTLDKPLIARGAERRGLDRLTSSQTFTTVTPMSSSLTWWQASQTLSLSVRVRDEGTWLEVALQRTLDALRRYPSVHPVSANLLGDDTIKSGVAVDIPADYYNLRTFVMTVDDRTVGSDILERFNKQFVNVKPTRGDPQDLINPFRIILPIAIGTVQNFSALELTQQTVRYTCDASIISESLAHSFLNAVATEDQPVKSLLQ